jgi:hypothetical protein
MILWDYNNFNIADNIKDITKYDYIYLNNILDILDLRYFFNKAPIKYIKYFLDKCININYIFKNNKNIINYLLCSNYNKIIIYYINKYINYLTLNTSIIEITLEKKNYKIFKQLIDYYKYSDISTYINALQVKYSNKNYSLYYNYIYKHKIWSYRKLWIIILL